MSAVEKVGWWTRRKFVQTGTVSAAALGIGNNAMGFWRGISVCFHDRRSVWEARALPLDMDGV